MAACVCPGVNNTGECGYEHDVVNGLCGPCRKNGCRPAGWTAPVPASPPVLEVPPKQPRWQEIVTVKNASPAWDRGVPFCTEECPSHDGKRCELLGLRPGNLCEPAVAEMAQALATQKGGE